MLIAQLCGAVRMTSGVEYASSEIRSKTSTNLSRSSLDADSGGSGVKGSGTNQGS